MVYILWERKIFIDGLFVVFAVILYQDSEERMNSHFVFKVQLTDELSQVYTFLAAHAVYP